MSNKPCQEVQPSGCGWIGTQRNRYFTGKYMAARDFTVEQDYFLSRHRLHNRVLHGWGVVCGLAVFHHPDPVCAKKWVVAKAGIAIDCCGRELVLFKDTAFELPLPVAQVVAPAPVRTEVVPASAQPAAVQSAAGTPAPYLPAAPSADVRPPQRPPQPDYPIEAEFLLCLRYAETRIEKVPALYSENACDPMREEYNRVCESAELVILDPKDVPGCWKRINTIPFDPSKDCCKDCDDTVPGPAGICLDPKCPCQDTVPLALIQWVPEDPKNVVRILTDGRRTLPTAPEFLTHIVGTNWPHGGTITMTHLREQLNGRLEVYFDRKIKPADGSKTGINEFTFVVQYGDIQRDVQFLPIDPNKLPGLERDCVAVYPIDPPILVDDGRGLTLSNHMIFVTLYCDFIEDCRGNPVDGNFLGARFPTGNGQKGSTFRSWFRVKEA